MVIPDLWQEFLEETQDKEKEYIRYLSKDIAMLQELKEEYGKDWELEELISFIIHEEANLMDNCKRRWINAQRENKSEGIPGTGSSHIKSRDGNPSFKGNLFLDKSQQPDTEPRSIL